ncbi:MAG: SUMF1/EgtB/PvdO family nonheme iron enzyme [Planctomycetota bacterium]
MSASSIDIRHTCPRCEGEVQDDWFYCPHCSMALEVPAGEQATLSDRIRYIRRESESRSRRQTVYRWGLTLASVLTVLIVIGGGILLFHPAFVPAWFEPGEIPVVELPGPRSSGAEPGLPPPAVLQYHWVPIPAGEFHFGRPGQKPPVVVELDAFEIMKYEVTNAQWLEYLGEKKNRLKRLGHFRNAVPRNWGWDPDSGEDPVVPLSLLDRPVVFITWSQASDFCRTFLRQKLNCGPVYLPTAAQWEMAARGTTDERNYPWGDFKTVELEVGVHVPLCNVRETGNRSAVDATAFPRDRSPFGVRGMGGNVSEFVGIWKQRLMAYRGGSFLDPIEDAKIHIETQISPNSSFTWRNVGFRAARDVEE